jgi:Mrp family chromosome partitioning ATPase
VPGPQHLAILTAGAAAADPLVLLSSRRLAAVVDSWRLAFDFIVIDTAPVATYEDALQVAAVAGNVLALSRGGHTPQRAMRDMLERLGPTHARVVGAVISHF